MINEVYNQSVLTFDGQDDYIDFGKDDIGGVFAEGSSAFTISGWINPQLLKSQATTYGVHNVFFARSSDRYSDNFEFGISEEGNLDVYIDEKFDNAIKTIGNGELTIGKWHFFAIVFNGGELTIYLDDNEYVWHLTGNCLNKASSHVTLGATLHNNVYFTGQLANISVWNYSCSQTEIQTQRYQPLAGNEEGLVAYWRLNEGEGTTVRDQTGNAHDGKLYGNPAWDLAEVIFMTSQSFRGGTTQGETEINLEENLPSTETTMPQEDSSTQKTNASAPVTGREQRQPKETKEIRKKFEVTPMQEIVKKLVGLSLPALILVLLAISTEGANVAIAGALTAVGGPFGILGGITLLGLTALLGDAVAGHGIEAILKAVYGERSKTRSVADLLEEIQDLPITDDLKLKLKNQLTSETKSTHTGFSTGSTTVEVVSE